MNNNLLITGVVAVGGLVGLWFLLGKPTSIASVQAGIEGLTSSISHANLAGYHSPSIRGGNFGAYPRAGPEYGLEGNIGKSPYANPLPSMGNALGGPPGYGLAPPSFPTVTSPYGLPAPIYGGHLRHGGYEFAGRMRGFDPDDVHPYAGLAGYPPMPYPVDPYPISYGRGFRRDHDRRSPGLLGGLLGGIFGHPDYDHHGGFEHFGDGGHHVFGGGDHDHDFR